MIVEKHVQKNKYMAISINELKVNNIVLSPKGDGTKKRCIIKALHGNHVSVDYLNMQNGKMEQEDIDSINLEPLQLMDSTLYAMGFRKADRSECSYPADKYYILKRSGNSDVAAIYNGQWHLLIPDDNGSYFDKQELYLHTLQNYLSSGKEVADEVSYEKFVELVNPYCISPFEPKEE